MIVRYATDGIDKCINICCASEEIIQKMKDNYYKNCKIWVIERDFLNSQGKIIKKTFYNKKCKFETEKIGCVEFKSKEKGEKFLKEHLDKGLFVQIKDIKNREEIKGLDIKYRIVPFLIFQLPYIGSYSCEHCPYCYGRSKQADFEVIGLNNRSLELEHILEDDWDLEKKRKINLKIERKIL